MESNLNQLLATVKTVTPTPGKKLQVHRKAFIVAVASLAALVSVSYVPWLLPVGEHMYQTLTAPTMTHRGTVYQVVFNDTETPEEIGSILDEVGLTLISGPSPQGVYRIEIPPQLDPVNTLEILRSRAELVMAEKEIH